jgi:predicted nucleic acid-binding protein
MPDSLVIDATCAIRLVVPGPAQPRYEEWIGGWKRAGHDLYAPGLWIYEVTSALCQAVRFGGLMAAEAERCLTQAWNLGVRLVAADEEQVRAAYAWTVRLNRAAAYDSFYLALAESLGCDLWTADQRLCHTVDLPWVHLAGAPS